MPEPLDLVDDGNCQTDMQTQEVCTSYPGMLTGDARLPRKIAKAQEQAAKSAFAQALADALRNRAVSDGPIETTLEEPK